MVLTTGIYRRSGVPDRRPSPVASPNRTGGLRTAGAPNGEYKYSRRRYSSMSEEMVTDGEGDVLEEFDDKWSDPTGSYYYCLILPNGEVEYHGTKNALRKKLTRVYKND